MNLRLAQKTLDPSVAALEFDIVHVQLQDSREGPGWTSEQCQVAARWYRRFLTLALEDDRDSLVPPPPVDQFWHRHILATAKYAQDCEVVFGGILHHDPSFGRSEDEADVLAACLDDTWNRLEAFGEPLASLFDAFPSASTVTAARCRAPSCHPERH